MSLWPLLGVLVVVIGLVLRLNAVAVVVAAGIVTGIAAGLDPRALLEQLGTGFTRNRFLAILVLTLPVIGLLERHGLRERAAAAIERMQGVTSARLLIGYQIVRQGAAMIGLHSLGGHPQTVRPLLVPMAEATAERSHGPLPAPVRERLRALCAGTDNVALFFGEDVFIAFGAVLLMQAFLAENGLTVEPLHIALWALPTAIAALLVHGARLARLEHRLAREIEAIRRGAA
jgi:uncharacterized membrane protein